MASCEEGIFERTIQMLLKILIASECKRDKIDKLCTQCNTVLQPWYIKREKIEKPSEKCTKSKEVKQKVTSEDDLLQLANALSKAHKIRQTHSQAFDSPKYEEITKDHVDGESLMSSPLEVIPITADLSKEPSQTKKNCPIETNIDIKAKSQDQSLSKETQKKSTQAPVKNKSHYSRASIITQSELCKFKNLTIRPKSSANVKLQSSLLKSNKNGKQVSNEISSFPYISKSKVISSSTNYDSTNNFPQKLKVTCSVGSSINKMKKSNSREKRSMSYDTSKGLTPKTQSCSREKPLIGADMSKYLSPMIQRDSRGKFSHVGDMSQDLPQQTETDSRRKLSISESIPLSQRQTKTQEINVAGGDGILEQKIFTLRDNGTTLTVPTKLKKVLFKSHYLKKDVNQFISSAELSASAEFRKHLEDQFSLAEDEQLIFSHIKTSAKMHDILTNLKVNSDLDADEVTRRKILIQELFRKCEQMQLQIPGCSNVIDEIFLPFSSAESATYTPNLIWNPNIDELNFPSILNYQNIEELSQFHHILHDIQLLTLHRDLQTLIAVDVLPYLKSIQPLDSIIQLKLYKAVHSLISQKGSCSPFPIFLKQHT